MVTFKEIFIGGVTCRFKNGEFIKYKKFSKWNVLYY